MSDLPLARPNASRLLVLCIMSVASIEFIQNGMLNFAAAYVMGGIGAAPEEFSYASMAYAICAVIALFNHRWCTERFGARGLIRVSLLLFAAGAMLCGLAQTPLAFIFGRAVQGVGGASFFVGARVQVNRLEGKTRMIGLLFFGYALMVGSALGPLFGALLLHHGSWRWIFWGIMPWLALAALASSAFSAEPDIDPASPARYHPRAFIWLVVAVMLAQYLIQQTPYDFFSHPEVLLFCLAMSVIAAIVFMRRHVKSAGDLDKWLHLAHRRYLFGLVFYFVCYCFVAANNYIMPVLVQQALGFDVPTTGVLLSVSFFAGIVFASIYARLLLSPRVPGLKAAMLVGTLMLAGYGLMMSGLNGTASFGRVAGILVLNGAFLSVFISAVAQGTFRQVDPSAFTHAYQTKNIVRQMAISGAVALSTVFLQARNALHFNRLGEQFSVYNPIFSDTVAQVHQSLPQADTNQVFSTLFSELVRQSMMLSCLDFFRLELWVGLALAVLIAAQKTFR